MASSDYSDLTDLDELDEEYSVAPARKGRGKGKGKGKAGADGYRIRHALKPPRATTYSTEALYKQIHSSDINLEPDYQREVVWPEAKQIGIIDSIFRNFYIPPVIFAVNAYDDGTETRTCIDGKQRLTSIHRFMDGLIPHKDPLTGDKLWYRDNPANKTRQHKKILPEKYRRMFDNKAVVCVEYQDLADADEREIFQRVQLGVALTPAEKLKVLTTPRARFMRTLQETFLNKEEDGLGGDSLDWNRSRGSDFRCLAQTVQCIAQGTPKTTSMQATERWLADPAPVPPALSQRITSTYRVFEALVRDVKHTRVFQRPAKIAPIEFIAVGILIARHKDSTTLAGLASAIAAMRADVRTVHDDIRNNQKVYKTLVAFIEAHHAPAPTRGELAASAAVPAVTLSSGTKRKAAPASASDEEDELDGDADAAGDSDEDYAPARKAVAPTPRKRKTAAAAPPTPPVSTVAGGSGTPPPRLSGLDVVRAAKTKIAAQAQAAAINVGTGAGVHGRTTASQRVVPTGPRGETPQMLPSPGMPFAFSEVVPRLGMSGGGAQGQGWGGGAGGVAAALEAGLMGGGYGSGGSASGMGGSGGGGSGHVKQESMGAPPLSGGSTGGRSYGRGMYEYDQYDRGDQRYWERDRERERDRGWGGRR